MIRKITNAVLGKNYVATALLYTGLALVIFAITPSQEGITSAGEEDSFSLSSCFVCDDAIITITTAGEEVDIKINGSVKHGIWIKNVTAHHCKLRLLSSSTQPCVKAPVRSQFREIGHTSVWDVAVPDAYKCQFNAN